MAINKQACLILITDQEHNPQHLNSLFYFTWDTKKSDTAELVAFLPNLEPLEAAFQKELLTSYSKEHIGAFLAAFTQFYHVPTPEYVIADLSYLATLTTTHLNNQVRITLKKPALLTNGTELAKGPHQLSGTDLVELFRYNHQLADYDCCQRQQALIFTLAKEVIKKAGILGLPKLMTATKSEIITSTSIKTGISLAKSYLLKQIKQTKTKVFPKKADYQLIDHGPTVRLTLVKKTDNL